MTSTLRATYKNLKAAIRIRATLASEMKDMEEAVDAAYNDFADESQNRGIDPGDTVALKQAFKREKFREKVDDSIRLAMVPVSESWKSHDSVGLFEDHFCGEDKCLFKAHPSRRNEFNGYMQSLYTKDHPYGRRCHVCFGRLSNPDNLAISLRNVINMSVEDLLLVESRTPPYATETTDDRMARSKSPDEWRALLPPMNCIACASPAVRCPPLNPRVAMCENTDSRHTSVTEFAIVKVAHFQGCIACKDNTPATQILVGWPSIRLCNDHHESRSELTECILLQASLRLRVDTSKCRVFSSNKRKSMASIPKAKKKAAAPEFEV